MASNNHFSENNHVFAANTGNNYLSQYQLNWARQQMPVDIMPFPAPPFGFNQLPLPMMNQMHTQMQFQQPFYPPPPQYDPNMYKYYQNFPAMNQRAHAVKHNNTTIQIGIGSQFSQQNPKMHQQQTMSPGKSQITRIMQRPTAMKPEGGKSPVCKAICDNEPQVIDKVFCDLQRIALNGCEIAEKVVMNHQKRPCFKKIDLLCGRLKQDLTNNNNVVANINSQGVAWAVKDFIFIFTRIINAWVILRGYVYNKSDGLDQIKSSIDPNLSTAFLEWQEATRKLSDCLVKSYVTLDQLVQNQRSSKEDSRREAREARTNSEEAATTPIGSPVYDAAFLNDLNRKLFDPHTMENSEETQRRHSENGTYFKSAVYEPLQKVSPTGSVRSCDYALNSIFNDEQIEAEMEKMICSPSDIGPKSPLQTSTPKTSPLDVTPKHTSFDRNPFHAKLRLAERFDLFGFKDKEEEEPGMQFHKFPVFGSTEIGGGDSMTPMISFGDQPGLGLQYDETKVDGYNSEMAGKVKFLINKVLDLKEAAFFISPSMARDCFPKLVNLIPDENSCNLNQIIQNIKTGERNTVDKIVFDLRQMIDSAKQFVQQRENANLAWLQTISCFESGLLTILLDEAFVSFSSSGSEE